MTEKFPKVKVGQEITLGCPASGTPEPEILWLKNGQPIDFSLASGLREQSGGEELHIHNAVVDYGGTYTCVASNSAGDDQVNIELEVWGQCLVIIGHNVQLTREQFIKWVDSVTVLKEYY